MKKSIPILFAAIALASLTWETSHAQGAMNSLQTTPTNEEGVFSRSKNEISGLVNSKAERSFRKGYHQTSEVEWSTLPDNSLTCRFFMNGILHRAFYSAHGQWIATVSSYDASKLDKGVYDKIKSVYYNSSIVYVNQIDKVSGNTIYLVNIQDEKSVKKLRVDGDDIEVVQQFEK